MTLLSLQEAIQINRQVREFTGTLNIIANYSFTQTAIMLGAYLKNLGCKWEIRTNDYGTLFENLLNKKDTLDSKCNIILIDSDIIGIGSSLRISAERKDISLEQINEKIEKIFSALEIFLSDTKIPSYIITVPVFHDAFEHKFSFFSDSLNLWLSFESKLRLFLNKNNLAFHISLPHNLTDQYWLLKNGEPLKASAISAWAGELANFIIFQQWGNIPTNPPKKMLVTDLDNTLWSGILGDDGAENLVFDNSEKGIKHLLYQKFLNQLANEGVLIAIATKNTDTIVESALKSLSLHIPTERFVFVEANWGPKSESIVRICKKANLLPESVVFIDDNALEVNEVEAKITNISCLQFPNNLSEIPAFFDKLRSNFKYFNVATEIESRLKSLKNASFIEEALNNSTDNKINYNDFLKQLNMQLEISYVNEKNKPRTFELINKTNQFNLNGDRISSLDFERYYNSSGCLTISLKDKDLDFGIIGALLIKKSDENTLLLDQFVLSCRVFSRGIEDAIINKLFEIGYQNLIFKLKKTQKNKPTIDFIKRISKNIDTLTDTDEYQDFMLTDYHTERFHGEIISNLNL